jgi:hypothetical protein
MVGGIGFENGQMGEEGRKEGRKACIRRQDYVSTPLKGSTELN